MGRELLDSHNITSETFDIWFRYYLREYTRQDKSYEDFADEINITVQEVIAVAEGWEQPSKTLLGKLKLKAVEETHEKFEVRNVANHPWVYIRKYKIQCYRQLSRCSDEVEIIDGSIEG